jgi:hypothetical protein
MTYTSRRTTKNTRAPTVFNHPLYLGQRINGRIEFLLGLTVFNIMLLPAPFQVVKDHWKSKESVLPIVGGHIEITSSGPCPLTRITPFTVSPHPPPSPSWDNGSGWEMDELPDRQSWSVHEVLFRCDGLPLSDH